MFKSFCLATMLLFSGGAISSTNITQSWIVVDNQDNNKMIRIAVDDTSHEPYMASLVAVFNETRTIKSPEATSYHNVNKIAEPLVYYHVYHISNNNGVAEVRIEVDLQNVDNPVKRATWILAAVGRTLFDHSGYERLWIDFINLPVNDHIPSTTVWGYTPGSDIYQWSLNNI